MAACSGGNERACNGNDYSVNIFLRSVHLSDGLGENLLEGDPAGSSSLKSVGWHLDCQGTGLRCYNRKI